jgi:hypothetical protein
VQVSSIKTRKTRSKAIRTRVENRVKARMLQYGKRGGKTGKDFQPKGRRLFELMAFAPGEVGAIRDDVILGLRIFT